MAETVSSLLHCCSVRVMGLTCDYPTDPSNIAKTRRGARSAERASDVQLKEVLKMLARRWGQMTTQLEVRADFSGRAGKSE